MAVTHPSLARVAALRKRWEGQEARLAAIAADLVAGRDWTVHLGGLPFVDEVPPLPGESRGRDLRGADLKRWLVPPIEVREAREEDAALVGAIGLEGLRHNTPLEGVTPFPVAPESADGISLAMRRGDRFLIARSGGRPAGVVRLGQRTELRHLTAERAYLELSGLSVLPSLRRHGIGAALRAAVETAARADGYDHVLLTTTLELGLVPWYERAGYTTALVRQVTCPEGTTYLDVVMLKPLLHPVGPEPARPTGRGAAAPASAPTGPTHAQAAQATPLPPHASHEPTPQRRIYRCS